MRIPPDIYNPPKNDIGNGKRSSIRPKAGEPGPKPNRMETTVQLRSGLPK